MRTDIQFLRGIAVLFVVLYHSGLGLLPEGYLGVDIFFVISGFLITKVIIEGLNENRFSFVEFYYRRAKRLLPALYSTLFFTTISGVFFLTQVQWSDYLDQLIGAITFTANFVLPGQTGYFEQASEGKPLLHIWSLSLEEQYYFLLPLFLFILPKRSRLLGLVILFIISIYWCFNWVISSNQQAPFLWRIGDVTKHEWAFYLLPTRAWELLLGSLIAWVMIHKPNLRAHPTLKWLALSGLFVLASTKLSVNHPGIDAVLIVFCTGILLIGNDNWLYQNVITRAIQKVGDWSYSIYLVHWPLFSFAHLGYVGDVPELVSVVLMFMSIILGYLQFKYVETPFRYLKINTLFSNWKPILTITVILASPPLFLKEHPLYDDNSFEAQLQANQGFGSECESPFLNQNELRVKEQCKNSNTPKVAIWGDSYAMHLVPGIAINNSIVQITKSACGPTPELALINKTHDIHWAKQCILFNQNAIEYITKTESIESVIMSSPLHYYLDENNQLFNGKQFLKPNPELLFDSYRNAVEVLHAAGKKIVFISPPPKNGKNIGECLERSFGPTILLMDSCTIKKSEYLEEQREVNDMLRKFGSISTVVMLDEVLCDTDFCRVIDNDIFIYRDAGHLSIPGSEFLFKNFELSHLSIK